MTLTQEQLQTVETHLEHVKAEILKTAEASSTADTPLDISQLGAILTRYARTKPAPLSENIQAQIISVPGIVWICAALSLVFGLLSVWYPTLSDIAKVFAGAIVGASAASVRK